MGGVNIDSQSAYDLLILPATEHTDSCCHLEPEASVDLKKYMEYFKEKLRNQLPKGKTKK